MQSVRWGEMGPQLLTDALTELGLDRLAQPREAFYPIKPLQTWLLFDPEQAEEVDRRVADSSAVHLWHEVLRRAGPITQVGPPAGSWLDRMAREWGVDLPDERVDVDWVTRALGRDGPVTPARVERLTRERDAARARISRMEERIIALRARLADRAARSD